MDESPVVGSRADGFDGQRMRVLPRPLVDRALRAPLTSQLVVTDIGFFPQAAGHRRERPAGAPQTIVIVCTAGCGSCEIEGRTHRVRGGQALVITAGTPHRYEADVKEPWTIWWMHVMGTATEQFAEACGARAGNPVIDLVQPTMAVALLDQSLRALEADDSRGSLLSGSAAAMHALYSLVVDKRTGPPGRPDPVAEAIEHLRRTRSRVAIKELASMSGVSPSHFSALFKRATGHSVLEYQIRLRMAEARQLLDTTDDPIATIAYAVGYDDPLYFSRQFRRIHGLAPQAYRRGRETPSSAVR